MVIKTKLKIDNDVFFNTMEEEDLTETIAELIASSGRCFECKDRLKPDSKGMTCTRCTNMKNVDKLKFIVITEQNMKENELFVHYCQWNGNEYELRQLVRFIDNSNTEEQPVTGDISHFSASLVKISEEAVDEHMKLSFGRRNCIFQKHMGSFTYPPGVWSFYTLNDHLHGCRLGKCFT